MKRHAYTAKKTGEAAKSRTRLRTFAVCLLAFAASPFVVSAAAQDLSLASSVVSGPDPAMPLIIGFSRPFAPRWKATYGIGAADETTLSSAFLRLDHQYAADQASDRNSRDNWRHFLGLQFYAGDGISLQGGIAKASGSTGNAGAFLSPTGYERLRLSTGARWRGKNWGLDTSFSFIPNGASRVPGDAGFIPGMGDSGPTWLFALSVARWF
jgi:hypothetical protein